MGICKKIIIVVTVAGVVVVGLLIRSSLSGTSPPPLKMPTPEPLPPLEIPPTPPVPPPQPSFYVKNPRKVICTGLKSVELACNAYGKGTRAIVACGIFSLGLSAICHGV